MYIDIVSIIVIGIIIILIAILIIVRNIVFKEVVISKKKDKKRMFEVLEEMGSYSLKQYEGLKLEDIEILSKDGFRLKGHYIENSRKTKKGIIIVHGYTANYYRSAQYADFLLEQGFNLLFVDARAHGESEGIYATYGKKEIEDLDLWVNVMKDRLGEGSQIGIHGHSMGAATVIMYPKIGGEKIDFIISEAAYSTGKGILKYQLKKAKIPTFLMYNLVNKRLKKDCGFSMEEINPIDIVKENKIPTLFIHGTADETIPVEMTLEMYKCKSGVKDLLIIKGASHINCYPFSKKEYEDAVIKLMKNVGV